MNEIAAVGADPTVTRGQNAFRVRGIVRRVLSDPARNQDDVEDFHWLQEGDPFGVTTTIDRARDKELVEQAVKAELESFVDQMLVDERIDEREDVALRSAVIAMIGNEAASRVLAPYKERFIVARANGMTLTALDHTDVLLRGDEVAYWEGSASLLDEKVLEQYVAGTAGLSFRIMAGVSIRAGATRGRVVEMGKAWDPIDEGRFTVTSHRSVFTGLRHTVEIDHHRVISATVWDNGVAVHSSGRSRPLLLRVREPEGTIAMVAAASANERSGVG